MEPLLDAPYKKTAMVPVTNHRQLWHPFTAFFAANYQVLDPTQREVLRLILHEYNPERPRGLLPSQDLFYEAIDILAKRANHLEISGWKRPETSGNDAVKGPNHYMRNPIEPTFFNMELGLNWLLGNAVKYVMRYQFKNGPEDLRKCARNIEMYVRWLSGEPNWSR
jgi:hypothetical protein